MAPFREAYGRLMREEGLSVGDLARRLDWVQPDRNRVRRTLGLRGGARYVSRENAELMMDALGLEPFEVGL